MWLKYAVYMYKIVREQTIFNSKNLSIRLLSSRYTRNRLIMIKTSLAVKEHQLEKANLMQVQSREKQPGTTTLGRQDSCCGSVSISTSFPALLLFLSYLLTNMQLPNGKEKSKDKMSQEPSTFGTGQHWHHTTALDQCRHPQFTAISVGTRSSAFTFKASPTTLSIYSPSPSIMLQKLGRRNLLSFFICF